MTLPQRERTWRRIGGFWGCRVNAWISGERDPDMEESRGLDAVCVLVACLCDVAYRDRVDLSPVTLSVHSCQT